MNTASSIRSDVRKGKANWARSVILKLKWYVYRLGFHSWMCVNHYKVVYCLLQKLYRQRHKTWSVSSLKGQCLQGQDLGRQCQGQDLGLQCSTKAKALVYKAKALGFKAKALGFKAKFFCLNAKPRPNRCISAHIIWKENADRRQTLVKLR